MPILGNNTTIQSLACATCACAQATITLGCLCSNYLPLSLGNLLAGNVPRFIQLLMPYNFNGLLPVNRLINNQRPEPCIALVCTERLSSSKQWSKLRQVKLFTGDNIELTIHKIEIIHIYTSMQAPTSHVQG